MFASRYLKSCFLISRIDTERIGAQKNLAAKSDGALNEISFDKYV